MFEFITDAVENALDIGSSILNVEDITKRQIAKLVSDGVSIYAIASATGLAEEVIQSIVDE